MIRYPYVMLTLVLSMLNESMWEVKWFGEVFSKQQQASCSLGRLCQSETFGIYFNNFILFIRILPSNPAFCISVAVLRCSLAQVLLEEVVKERSSMEKLVSSELT